MAAFSQAETISNSFADVNTRVATRIGRKLCHQIDLRGQTWLQLGRVLPDQSIFIIDLGAAARTYPGFPEI
jgi:hypothetical protein